MVRAFDWMRSGRNRLDEGDGATSRRRKQSKTDADFAGVSPGGDSGGGSPSLPPIQSGRRRQSVSMVVGSYEQAKQSAHGAAEAASRADGRTLGASQLGGSVAKSPGERPGMLHLRLAREQETEQNSMSEKGQRKQRANDGGGAGSSGGADSSSSGAGSSSSGARGNGATRAKRELAEVSIGRGKNKQGGLLGGTSSVMSAREMARNAVARSHDEIEEELAIAKVKRNSFIEHPSSDMFRTLAKLHTSAHTMKTPFGDEADDDDPSFSGYSGNATTKGAASTRGKDKDKDRRLSLEEKLAQMESNFSP